MQIGLAQGAIAHRHGDTVTLFRLSPTGAMPAVAVAGAELADAWRLSTGDVVEGHWEPLDPSEQPASTSGALPAVPAHRLARVDAVNGLRASEAHDRPHARLRRTALERAAPRRRLTLALTAGDEAGRVLDYAAPLAAGAMGVVAGPHGSGMTTALRTVAAGVRANAPDCPVIVLLVAPRMEEVTDWRRRLPDVETVVCPAADSAEAIGLRAPVADLVLAAAQRQTEMGRDVVLLIDSLTALWVAQLQAEEADAQEEADRAAARRSIRDWVDAAGRFAEETALGPGLGGSLTLIGAAWTHPVDTDAEEERELAPDLRLMEHITPALTWRVTLAGELAARRMHPAVDLAGCGSDHEAALLGEQTAARLRRGRARLGALPAWEAHRELTEAAAATADTEGMATLLAGSDEPQPADLSDRWQELLRRHAAGPAQD